MTDFQKQVLEAAGWTFLETFLVTLAPAVAVANFGDWNALLGLAASAALSAGSAAISVVKSYIVRNVGAKESPLITGGSCE